MLQFNIVVQIATATLLGLVCILLVKHARSGQSIWTGIGFTISILCYTIVESDVFQSVLLLKIIASIGAISTPFFFWLLARAIFDDHFSFRPVMLGWLFVLLLPNLNFFADGLIPWPTFRQNSVIVAHIASLSFVFAGLYTALKTKQNDLVDSRIKFRNIFLFVTAGLIGVTLIVELIAIERNTMVVLQVLQRSAIFAITLYFLLSNLGMRSGFFFKEIPRTKAQGIEDEQLSIKLHVLMEKQRVYKKEGLTIGQLAEMLNEQEYRLRRLINGQLGFRNFSDFVNQFRVNEACEILSDPAQSRKTILEIAYDLGYQSIGPFNKAFKELKGTTPTAYRKGQTT